MSEQLTLRTPDPLPHQAAFWSDMTPDADIAIVGPQGCGKTLALAIKIALLSALNAPHPGILVTPTLGLFRKIHEREWPLILEECGVHIEVRGGNEPQITWPWNSVTHVFSGDTPQRIVGVNAAYAGIDEPAQMDREVYERTKSRLREPRARLRQMALTGTPEGLNWFSDLFADPVPPRRTIWASTWHESVEHYRQNLRDTYGYDQSLFDTYARGRFVPLRVGRAYGQFDRGKHVAPVAVERGLPLVLACDFNVDALRWYVMQFLPREIRVVDEIALGGGATTEQAAQEFCRRHGTLRAGVIVTGDAAGNARTTKATRTDYQVLREELSHAFSDVSVLVPATNPRVKERVDAVNYRLSGRAGVDVVIDPRCKDLILDLERVVWKEGSVDIDKSDPKLTHASDAFGYGIWAKARPRLVDHTPSVQPTVVPLAVSDPILGARW